MKFKTDENLPEELASHLTASGHDCETVAQESLTGAPDDHLLAAAHREGRVLLTLDKGIANVQVCPPESFSGIVLFRPDSIGRGAVMSFVRRYLSEVLQLELKGRLVVVTGRGVRVR